MSILRSYQQNCTKWNETLHIHTRVLYESLLFQVSRQIPFPQNRLSSISPSIFSLLLSHFFLLIFMENATFPSLPLFSSYFHAQFLALTNAELILKNPTKIMES